MREALDDALRGYEIRDDARLIASELVTNAVLHSGCGPDELIEFEASLDARSLIISVSDPYISGQDAHLREEGPPGGGYGLRLVDRLARRWGSEHHNGQRVWAELPVS